MTTHVANGGHHTIYVNVDCDRDRLTSVSNSLAIKSAQAEAAKHAREYSGSAGGWGVNVSGGYNHSDEYGNSRSNEFSSSGSYERDIIHVVNSCGYTKILPGNYLPFRPSGGGTVYISIYYQMHC